MSVFLRFGRRFRARSFSPVRSGRSLRPVFHDCPAGCRGACARTAAHGDHGDPAKLAADRGGRPRIHASRCRPAMRPTTSRPFPVSPRSAVAAATVTRCCAACLARACLLTDGGQMIGACPGRMDAPSSYISPETYDLLTVTKGPQTVIWGPGASAGVARFDREPERFGELGTRLHASVLAGSMAVSTRPSMAPWAASRVTCD